MPNAKCLLPPDTRAQSSSSNGALTSPLRVIHSTMRATMRFATGAPADDDKDDELPLLVPGMLGLVPFAESNSQLDIRGRRGKFAVVEFPALLVHVPCDSFMCRAHC